VRSAAEAVAQLDAAERPNATLPACQVMLDLTCQGLQIGERKRRCSKAGRGGGELARRRNAVAE
jgi:hypothetical protein